ncbi:MAG: hypothetical protein GF333_01865 [Candidatus Omnitrophica bacterium]|nr:hypothetical protein [Candidatus Omnitrophota bacterium]
MRGQRGKWVILIAAAGVLWGVPRCEAGRSLRNVSAAPEEFHRTQVTIQGEAIGEPLKTVEGFWVNLSSEGAHLSAWVKDREAVDKIVHWGRYGMRGDRVEVTGVFYRKCPVHHTSGIHVQSLRVRERGGRVFHPVSARKKTGTRAAAIICLTFFLIYLIKERNRRRQAKDMS